MHFGGTQYKQKGRACRQAGFTPILILVGILVIIGVGGAYILGRSANPKPSSIPAITSQTPQPTSNTESTGSAETANPDLIGANWKTYTNQNMNFSIEYPALWTIKDSGPDQYKFEKIALSGQEGSIIIQQGSGFGGGSCQGKLIDILTPKGTLKMCDFISGTSELWRTDYGVAGTLKLQNGILSLFITASTNNPQTYHDAIIKILSTFKFTNQNQSILDLPKDKCPCWDSANNSCLPQSACQ